MQPVSTGTLQHRIQQDRLILHGGWRCGPATWLTNLLMRQPLANPTVNAPIPGFIDVVG